MKVDLFDLQIRSVAGSGCEICDRGAMICIIEDDPSVLRALKRLVSSAGYPAAAFSSAEEFLASEQANRPGCLILDVNLPGIGGLELQDQLVAAAHRVPTIFISAFDDTTARARALENGAVAFLKKPFDGRSLLEAIDRGLRPKDAPKQAQPSS